MTTHDDMTALMDRAADHASTGYHDNAAMLYEQAADMADALQLHRNADDLREAAAIHWGLYLQGLQHGE